MKVIGPNGVSQPAGARTPRTGSGAGFRLPTAGEAAAPAQTTSVSRASGLMGMDALLALQEVGNPLERKRRAVNRAGRILDDLEHLKIALLEGSVSEADLSRLQRSVREAREHTDDPKLEAVLEEVELRAAVELAKLQQANHAA